MKFENHVENVFNCFYLGGDEIFLKGGENKSFFILFFIVSNSGGELVFMVVI